MSLMKDRAEMLELDWGQSFGRQAIDGKGASALKIKKKQTCEFSLLLLSQLNSRMYDNIHHYNRLYVAIDSARNNM